MSEANNDIQDTPEEENIVEQISEDVSRLWYCDYSLGEIDHGKWQIVPAKSRPLICAYAQISEHKPKKVLPM